MLWDSDLGTQIKRNGSNPFVPVSPEAHQNVEEHQEIFDLIMRELRKRLWRSTSDLRTATAAPVKEAKVLLWYYHQSLIEPKNWLI